MIDIKTINDVVTADLLEATNKNKKITQIRDYYKGIQKTVLSNKQKAMLSNLLRNPYSDNICLQIVTDAVNRISFERFGCPNEVTKSFLDDFVKTSKFNIVAYNAIRDCIRDGNSIMSVDWKKNKKRVQCYNLEWWDGVTGCNVVYEDGERLYFVREWYPKTLSQNRDALKIKRRFIQDADSIARFISEDNGATWQLYTPDSDKNLHKNSFGSISIENSSVKYVHLANGNNMIEEYGISDIDNVPSWQDQLTDIQFSMSSASRLTGYQQYTVTGVGLKDADGKPVEFNVGAGNFFHAESPDAKFGTLPAGDIKALIDLYNIKLKRICQICSMPIFPITGGDWPSGDALIRAELPAVLKARRQITQIASAFEEIAYNAVLLTNTNNKENIPIDINTAPIHAHFSSPEQRDVVALSSVVHNMAQNISPQQAMRTIGIPEDQITRVMEEIEEMRSTVEQTNNNEGNPKQGKNGGQ